MPAFPSGWQAGRRDGFFFIPIPMLLRRTGDMAAVLLRSAAESGAAEFPASGRGGGRYEDGCETVRLSLLPEVSESRSGSSGSAARRLVPAGHRQKCITGGGVHILYSPPVLSNRLRFRSGLWQDLFGAEFPCKTEGCNKV